MSNQTNLSCSVAEKDESKTKTFEVRFDGFADLPARKGVDFVKSPKFTYLGHQWYIKLYPGGDHHSADGKVAIYLSNRSKETIDGVNMIFTVEKSGKPIASAKGENLSFEPNYSKGTLNILDRSAAIAALHEGPLIIKVELKKTYSAGKLTSQFIPDNPLCKNILQMFNDEKSSDVVFELTLKMKHSRKTSKRAKTSPTTFYAHRLILKQGAPMLAEFCGESSLVTIPDVSPDIFSILLGYVYGRNMKKDDFEAHAKAIIDAADRFGVVSLKLEAEAWYVKSNAINIENMMDNLHYADSKNCALLKEAVMDFIVANSLEVAEKVSLKDVPHGLFADLLTAMNMGKQKKDGNKIGNNLSTIRVDELRGKLHEKGKDVDGSRETLVKRLQEK